MTWYARPHVFGYHNYLLIQVFNTYIDEFVNLQQHV